MQKQIILSALALLPYSAFSTISTNQDAIQFVDNSSQKNAIIQVYQNEITDIKPTTFARSQNVPTSVIRLESNLENIEESCEVVQEEVKRTINDHITPDKFLYFTYVNCVYDPKTQYASHLIINSYFDPINDEGIAYLTHYLEEYNGKAFFDTFLNIEQAKGLVISLTFKAGQKKTANKPPFIEYRSDNNNLYFESNYEMVRSLQADIRENFFSNKPEKILPFLSRWLFPRADSLYRGILLDANSTQLQPERIFLMEDGDKIFVNQLRYYYANNCQKYENSHCLKLNSVQSTHLRN